MLFSRWGRNHGWNGPSCILYNEVSFLLCLHVMQICRPQETYATESKLHSFFIHKRHGMQQVFSHNTWRLYWRRRRSLGLVYCKQIKQDIFIEFPTLPAHEKLAGKHRKLCFRSTAGCGEFKALDNSTVICSVQSMTQANTTYTPASKMTT